MGKYKTVLLTNIAPLATDHVRPFDGERPYIATGGLNDDEVITPEMVTYEGRPSRADLTVQAGDVCFARMKETLKFLHVKPEHSEMLLSTGFAVLRPLTDQLNARYLLHYLRTPAFQNEKDSLCSGATQKAITNGKFESLKIPLPPLEEQKRISAMMDNADELRRKRRESIAALDSLTQSIFLDFFDSPESKKCLPEFLHAYFLIHPTAQRYLTQKAKGAIMDGLNMGTIKELPVTEAPMERQQQFKAVSEKIEAQRTRLLTAQRETENLFTALQQKAFSRENSSTRSPVITACSELLKK